MIDVNTNKNNSWSESESWLEFISHKRKTEWLGDGSTSDKIINILKEKI
jgi:hypothetical protein